jgi:hypothetical protein
VTSRRISHLALALASAFAANGAAAAVDMRGILEAEYADIRAGLCPSAAVTSAGGGAAMDDYDAHKIAPVRVFDNLYYVGMDNISAWALTTSEGIILFEAMMVANWERTIVDGLADCGLPPGAALRGTAFSLATARTMVPPIFRCNSRAAADFPTASTVLPMPAAAPPPWTWANATPQRTKTINCAITAFIKSRSHDNDKQPMFSSPLTTFDLLREYYMKSAQ